MAKKYRGSKVDIAIGIGTQAAQVLKMQLKNSPSKVVFASVTDPQTAGLVKNLDKPQENVTGVSNFIPVEPQLEFYKKLLPNLSTLGIIYNPSEANSVKLVQLFKQKGHPHNIDIITQIAVRSSEVATAANSLLSKVDAILVTNDNTALSAFQSIVKIAKKAEKPVLVSDIDLMGSGAFASIGPDQYKIGRQTGRMVTRLLQGQSISQNSVEFPEKIVDTIS